MKNRVLKFLTLGAALCGMSAWAAGTLVPESTIDAGGTISLGEGEFTTYVTTYAKGKTLVFEGAGADKTIWWYGKASGPSAAAGSDGGGCSDYSLEGSNVKFVNLTLQDNYTENNYYRGFVRPASLTFENCTIKNMMGYLGVGDVHFKNCTFDVDSTCEYAVKTYSGQDFYFEDCTFKGNNKGFIQAYMQDGTSTRHTVVIKDCVFESGSPKNPPSKTAVYFYDQAADEGARWDIHLIGNNTNSDGVVPTDKDVGEWLWGSMKYQSVAQAKVYQDLDDGYAQVWNENAKVKVAAEYPEGYAPEAPALTYTEVENLVEGGTKPVAYVTQLPEAEAQADGLECEYVFQAWSESDRVIFDKAYNASTKEFDDSQLSDTEKARFVTLIDQLTPYVGCHADFVVKFDRPVKAGTVALAGEYGTWGMLSFQLGRDMAAGEELRLLNDGAEGLQIRFSYGMILTGVVDFYCGAVNYSALNGGTKMTVELRLYEPVEDLGMAEIPNGAAEKGPYMVISSYEHTFASAEYREVRLSTVDAGLTGADGAAIASPTTAQTAVLTSVKGTVGANTPAQDMVNTGVIPAAQAANASLEDAVVTGYVKICLETVQVAANADGSVAQKAIAYDVTPMAIITRVEGGETTVTEQEIPNDKITAPITFRLPVTAEFVKGARIKHTDDADRFAQVEVEGGKRFVTVSADHFSIFTLYPDEVAEAAVGSSNIMAIKRVPGGSARAEVVAPVPWKRLDDVAQDMTVDRLVATGRANGDEIAVWNEARRDYDVWRWSETLGWEVGQSTVSGVTAPAAATTTLKQGTAVWFKRGTPAAAYSEIGGYTPGLVTSKPEAVAGKAANTLMINPYFEAVDLAKIENAGTGDQIQIISTKKVYVWKGQWGWLKLVQKTTPFGATVTREEFVPEASIPLAAGEGFWYISRGGTPTVDWKAIKAN